MITCISVYITYRYRWIDGEKMYPRRDIFERFRVSVTVYPSKLSITHFPSYIMAFFPSYLAFLTSVSGPSILFSLFFWEVFWKRKPLHFSSSISSWQS